VRVIPDQIDFSGPIVIIGFGSLQGRIAADTAPHTGAAREYGGDLARRLEPPAGRTGGVRFEKLALRPDNYRTVLTR